LNLKMSGVRAKKHLGQHFLKNKDTAQRIATSLTHHCNYENLLEIGPGTGILTQHLLQLPLDLTLVEIDRESVDYLKKEFPTGSFKLLNEDFLDDFNFDSNGKWGVVGNFPYNISSQIFFKIYNHRQLVEEVVCMLQKEVAQRIASPHGNKNYGILSVLLQAFYEVEYLFSVEAHEFHPPPKVTSGVIRLRRNEVKNLAGDESQFKIVVKQAFQNRRKTLRNALKPLNLTEAVSSLALLNKRAEQLQVEEFIYLTNQISQS